MTAEKEKIVGTEQSEERGKRRAGLTRRGERLRDDTLNRRQVDDRLALFGLKCG